ncbi:CU044_5270 family protein [Streptomyces sp. NPDC004609]|uniref:CU044_5270 family protein n=1 Tax=Streptomyces sp. NPDC004609 TaxID=3364704 RepID=UPI0036A6E072
MTRTLWRRTQEPLDHAELAGLLPAPGDPDLSRDRRRLLEEHLMREIQQTPEPKPVRPVRRALFIGVPVTALAVTTALVVGAITDDGSGSDKAKAPVVRLDDDSTGKVATTLNLISTAAAKQRVPEPKPGQYVYIKSRVSYLSQEINADSSKTKSRVEKPHLREVWLSPDGKKGWLIEEGRFKNGITLDDDGPGQPLSGYNYLKTLPTDPDVLLEKIYKDSKGQGKSRGPHAQAFTAIGDLLREEFAPPKLSAALYQAAAKIPGVVVLDKAEDGFGRDGIAVAHTDASDGSRSEWVFDRSTYAYLGERVVQLKGFDDVKAGTVTGRTAVLERAVVDSKGQRPEPKRR